MIFSVELKFSCQDCRVRAHVRIELPRAFSGITHNSRPALAAYLAFIGVDETMCATLSREDSRIEGEIDKFLTTVRAA